ncbi:MAG: Gfo/Idh/MocA family oxidoreductase [Pseudomonadota bacterium]
MGKRYGLIGCGMMGLEHVRNVNLLEGAHVAHVFDPVAAQAEQASAEAGGAAIAQSLETIVADESLDAFIVASPNHLHIDQLEQIARQRQVPILCEKPLFTREEDIRRIETLQQHFRAPIWVAMEYRYMPPIAELIAQADDVTGGIKMLTMLEHRFPFLEKVGNWNRFNANTGGTFVEKCCHFFDLMRFMLKAEPVSVMSSAGQIINHLDECYDGRTPDIWDGGYVIFDFNNGTRAMLELAMFADGSKWNESIHAIGPLGKIACRLPGPQRFWPEELGPSPHPELVVSPRHPKKPTKTQITLDESLTSVGDHHGSTFYQHTKFLDMIVEQGEPEVGLIDGIWAVIMGLSAQRAAEEHQVVRIGDAGLGARLSA